jgi:hypothetical protein
MSNDFSLLDEFAAASSMVGSNPIIAKLAAAKWQSHLLAAFIACDKPNLSIEAASEKLTSAAREVSIHLGLDPSDHASYNIVIQVMAPHAAKELAETGDLSLAWKNKFSSSIGNFPPLIKIINTPKQATNSLGMTLSNHYSQLFVMANEFSFLREPHEIVSLAHKKINPIAEHNISCLSAHEDRNILYQNQLNCLRNIYISVYKKESEAWKSMLNKEPNLKNLCLNGIPMDGVNQKFIEQASELSSMLGIAKEPIQAMSVSR